MLTLSLVFGGLSLLCLGLDHSRVFQLFKTVGFWFFICLFFANSRSIPMLLFLALFQLCSLFYLCLELWRHDLDFIGSPTGHWQPFIFPPNFHSVFQIGLFLSFYLAVYIFFLLSSSLCYWMHFLRVIFTIILFSLNFSFAYSLSSISLLRLAILFLSSMLITVHWSISIMSALKCLSNNSNISVILALVFFFY